MSAINADVQVIDANVDMNKNPDTIQEWIVLVKNMIKPCEKHVAFNKSIEKDYLSELSELSELS